MQEFKYVKAQKIDELLSLLSQTQENPKILSGGTDLISQLSDSKIKSNLIIDIKGIPEVNEIKFDQSGLFVGSAVNCLSLSSNTQLQSSFPGLLDGFSLIGGPQIQGRATIGGNLCNASPAADSIPTLIVHNARCVITGQNGQREVPVEEFCIAPGKTVLKKDEFLVGVQIPNPVHGFGACYQRFIPRNEMDIAVVGVGSSLTINNDSKIEKVRVALGAVGPTPLVAKGVDKVLIGQSITDTNLESKIKEASQIVKQTARPITDMRGSAEQRTHLVEVLTRRTFLNAIERAKSSLR